MTRKAVNPKPVKGRSLTSEGGNAARAAATLVVQDPVPVTNHSATPREGVGPEAEPQQCLEAARRRCSLLLPKAAEVVAKELDKQNHSVALALLRGMGVLKPNDITNKTDDPLPGSAIHLAVDDPARAAELASTIESLLEGAEGEGGTTLLDEELHPDAG